MSAEPTFNRSRRCSRPGCGEAAVVTLSYRYENGQVWLDDLSAHADPHSYDMCDRHASRLTAPRGWQVADRRSELAMRAAPKLLAG